MASGKTDDRIRLEADSRRLRMGSDGSFSRVPLTSRLRAAAGGVALASGGQIYTASLKFPTTPDRFVA